MQHVRCWLSIVLHAAGRQKVNQFSVVNSTDVSAFYSVWYESTERERERELPATWHCCISCLSCMCVSVCLCVWW